MSPNIITQRDPKTMTPAPPNLVMNSFKDITWPANRSARLGNNNVLLGHKWGSKMFEPQACCPHPIINEWSHQASLHPHKHVYIWIHIVNRVKILGGLDVGSQKPVLFWMGKGYTSAHIIVIVLPPLVINEYPLTYHSSFNSINYNKKCFTYHWGRFELLFSYCF